MMPLFRVDREVLSYTLRFLGAMAHAMLVVWQDGSAVCVIAVRGNVSVSIVEELYFLAKWGFVGDGYECGHRAD